MIASYILIGETLKIEKVRCMHLVEGLQGSITLRIEFDSGDPKAGTLKAFDLFSRFACLSGVMVGGTALLLSMGGSKECFSTFLIAFPLGAVFGVIFSPTCASQAENHFNQCLESRKQQVLESYGN